MASHWFRYTGAAPVTLIGVGEVKPGQTIRVPDHMAASVAQHRDFEAAKKTRRRAAAADDTATTS